MSYIRVKLQKCVCFLTEEEIGKLLLKDTDLFKLAIARGKGISRAEQLQERVDQKKELS